MEIIDEMNKYLAECQLEEAEKSTKMVEKILEYIAENKHICYTLLHQHIGTSFEKRVKDVAKQFLKTNKLTQNPEINAYLSSFIISGAINVTKDWLANNAKEEPKQIAELINTFITHGLSSKELLHSSNERKMWHACRLATWPLFFYFFSSKKMLQIIIVMLLLEH